MSRKQWGHGYYQGLKEAKDYLGIKKYLVCMSNDSHVSCVYRVLKKVDDIFTVEDVTDCFGLISAQLAQYGAYGVSDKDDIDFHNVFESSEKDLTNGYSKYFWFSNDISCNAFCARDFEQWCIEKRKKEVAL